MNVTVPYTALDFGVVLRKVGDFEVDPLITKISLSFSQTNSY